MSCKIESTMYIEFEPNSNQNWNMENCVAFLKHQILE